MKAHKHELNHDFFARPGIYFDPGCSQGFFVDVEFFFITEWPLLAKGRKNGPPGTIELIKIDPFCAEKMLKWDTLISLGHTREIFSPTLQSFPHSPGIGSSPEDLICSDSHLFTVS